MNNEQDLLEKKACLMTILNNSKEGIIITDSKDTVVFMNEEAERLISKKRDAYIGEQFGYPVTGDRKIEIEVIAESQNVRIAEMQALEVVWNGEASMLIFINDITERERTHESLKKSMEKIKRINDELEQFTYLASHDLQAPLRSIVSFCEFLKDDIGTDLNEKASQDIGFIIDGTKRMQQLIRDLLILSKTGKTIRMQRFSLKESVEEARQSLKYDIEDKDVEFIMDPLPEIFGDKILFTQLYQNLIHNAIKFTEKDPCITITAEKRKDSTWVLGVQDNGIGIEDEFLEGVFLPFRQLHSRSKYKGSGVGLSICSKIIKLHGGRIWTESDGLGKGAHFRFVIDKALTG